MSADERIAVIGMACRVPGAPDAAAFWRNLRDGVDSVRRFDDGSGFGYLDHLTDFDAALFGYSDDEATLLDPQHRIFLEVAWWALEDAGYDPARTAAHIGVFAGCGANRYVLNRLRTRPPGEWDDILAGASCDYLPARAAYALGLNGPAVAVQTACSSSLVAVCQAAQSLLDYRCDLAIAGGAAVVSTRQTSRPGATIATDGACRPFDAHATGQVFGNGGGAVVLRRLADAVTDGDHIHAVLTGWAVNNDGAERAGWLVPGVAGQAAVVAEAIAAAAWDPASIGLVEGHGSGTPVGDAIEVDALTRAFRPGSGSSCVLGSVKSNVGNLDAAAGVVGLIKAVFAVRDGVIPPTLHFTGPHPDVDLAAGPFEVTTKTRDWPGARRAGVSSFGLGGTNAHVLVEPAPDRTAPDATPGWVLLPLSTGDDTALRDLAGGLAAWAAPATDTGYTLTVGRRRLPCRAAIVCRDTDGAVAALTTIARGSPVPLDPEAPGPLRDAAAAWLGGADVTPAAGRRIPLPGYPFQRRRLWVDA